MASMDETHGAVATVNSLTFTGCDQWCDIAELIEIAARARPLRIEWAVLAGTSTGNDPRFPDLETIARFRDRTAAAGTGAALHLCGRLARAVAANDLDEAVGLGRGFRRIQINAESHDYGQLAKLAHRTGARVIAQEQHGFADKRAPSERLHYLDDGSGGRGISQLHGWTKGWESVRCGYAGGVGPDNIGEAIRRATDKGGPNAWLDMESSIRTNERLDTAKVNAVIRQAMDHARQ